MSGIDDLEEQEDGGETVFRDVIFLALAGFIAVVLMLLPHVNPSAKANNDVSSPGNVIVEVRWPDELNTDVDLWVQAPGDVAVGYSNKAGKIFNLLRDDLGFQADATKLNYEVSYSRGVPSGQYTVNVHLYRDLSQQLPMPVDIMVSVKPNAHASAKQILSTTVKLKAMGQELTAFRFALDKNGELQPGSVHDLPKPLRIKPAS